MLQDIDTLSEDTIVPSCAILMNLGLRTQGIKECTKDSSLTLTILNLLMESENNQIKTYVNGLLYSLFSDRGMRTRAREVGMEEQLIYMKEVSDDQLKIQIDFVIQKLNSGCLIINCR
jgi:hypothetical protein